MALIASSSSPFRRARIGVLVIPIKTPGRNEPCPCGSGKKSKRCCQAKIPTPSAQGTSVSSLLGSANTQLRAGHLDEAEAICRSVLLREPNRPEALHCLGLVEVERGHLESGVVMIGRATRLEPTNAAYYCNLGRVLMNLGKFTEAAIVLSKSVALDARSFEAHLNLGRALTHLGRAADAISEFEKALSVRGKDPKVLFSLGNSLLHAARSDEAISAYERAIKLQPAYADAYANLGKALGLKHRYQDAILAYKKSLEIDSGRPEVFVNLAIILAESGEYKQAIEICKQGLDLSPDWPELYFNLGNAFQLLGDLDAAIESYRNAIDVRGTYAEAYSNLGRAMQEKCEIELAIGAYERALQINPKYVIAFSNLIYLHAFTRRVSPAEQWQFAAKWEIAALSDEARAEARSRTFANRARTGRKLRLGIVSAELGRHAVAEFLQPVLENLDRSRIEVILYPTVDRTGMRAEQFRALADEYYSLSAMIDAAAAEKIRGDGIDVLLDTTGHTDSCRLGIFAHRAAPVQCTWIGFWASTGLTEMDYCLGDKSFPVEFDSHFRETIWRLGHSGNVYRGDASLPESAWQPSADGSVVWLGSFNKYAKIGEQCVALWAKVMHRIPESRLLLEDRTPFDYQMHKRILDAFEKRGIGNGRITFSSHRPGWEAHMLLYDRLDIALDTVPFNSGTTAYDALWMGVPLVTLRGDWGGGRMASVVLESIGRPEWIARDPDEFVAIVKGLARNVELRRSVRKTQRSLMSGGALCDAQGMAREVEEAFEAMYDRYLTNRSIPG
jgi:predicted O-linked N-acetylglucosamine transferase (SPINDLY family)